MKANLHSDSVRYVDLAIVLNIIFGILNLLSDPSEFYLNLLIVAPFLTAISLIIIRLTCDLKSQTISVLLPIVYAVFLGIELVYVGIPSLSQDVSSPDASNKGILLVLFIHAMPAVYVASRILLLFLMLIYTRWTFRLDEKPAELQV